MILQPQMYLHNFAVVVDFEKSSGLTIMLMVMMTMTMVTMVREGAER